MSDRIVGVIGPHDLVSMVSAVVNRQSGLHALPLQYVHENDAPRIVEEHRATVDAWLFTGVIPFSLAEAEGLLRLPSAYVDYTGSVLLEGIVRLVRQGYDAEFLSVDTLKPTEALSSFHGAEIPTHDVKIIPYRYKQSSEDIAAAHLEHYRASQQRAVAITCITSVHELLRGKLPVLRLAPSPHSILAAVRQLQLSVDSKAHEDAQIVLALVDFGQVDERAERTIRRQITEIGGVLTRASDGLMLLVTTLGPMREATADFTTLPFTDAVASQPQAVSMGFGVGRTAAEADELARRALGKARLIGGGGVVSLRNDVDIVLQGASAAPIDGERAAVLAQRANLPVATIERLRAMHLERPDETITSLEISQTLDVSQRTARRILQRLELSGLARRTGDVQPQDSGRPLNIFSLRL